MSKLTNNYGIKSNTLLGQILDVLQPTIEKRIEAIRKYHLNEDLRYSKFSEEIDRLTLVFDMAKSIGSYALPTDKLISIESGISPKSNLEIYAKIERESQEFRLSTEVIYAGGYNIQRLHLRYITHTTLPKGVSNEALVIKAKIQKLNKIDRLQKDVSRLENLLPKARLNFQNLNKLKTQAQKVAHYTKDWNSNPFLTWNDLNEHAQEYFGNKEAHEMSKKEDFRKYAKSVDNYKASAKWRIKALKDDILKAKAKVKEAKKQ